MRMDLTLIGDTLMDSTLIGFTLVLATFMDLTDCSAKCTVTYNDTYVSPILPVSLPTMIHIYHQSYPVYCKLL